MFSSNQDERNDIQQLSEQIRNTNAEAEIDRNGEIDEEPSSQSQPVTIPSGTQTTPTVATAKGRKGKTVPRTITTRTQTAGKEKVATQLEGEATEATSCSPEIALPLGAAHVRAEIEAPHPQIVKAEKQRGTARTPTERRETAMEMLLAKPKKKTTTKTPTDQHPQPKTNPQRPTEAQQQTIAVVPAKRKISESENQEKTEEEKSDKGVVTYKGKPYPEELRQTHREWTLNHACFRETMRKYKYPVLARWLKLHKDNCNRLKEKSGFMTALRYDIIIAFRTDNNGEESFSNISIFKTNTAETVYAEAKDGTNQSGIELDQTIKPSQSQAPGPGPIPQHHNNQNLPQRPNNGKRGGYEGKQYNPNYVNQRSNGQNGGKTGGGNDGQTGGSGNQYQD
ncbi:hypothetical protein PSTG_01211 [Puccinia striiformis f. sp. tritici PST-78]|uniref:Uncharacterized protein n=1 Tax=Puccinia striiformis f. sp. tritici PST-78 TaxID=1165861 RepID=A0A0L0W2T2_9BASI|nr:hypothetical protein PSTG_01211 [Puccinia striiformis f. sp. tritici PST-78]